MRIIDKKYQNGFTLIEMSVVVGLFLMFFAISTVSLSSLIPRANFVTSYESLQSDIKNQQLKAMTGYTEGMGDGSAYGIYLESDQYVLFTGPSYNPNATDNFTIRLSPGLTISEITFPSSSIVFLQNSGEIPGFSETESSFKLISNNDEEYLFNLNSLGVVLPN